MKTLWTFLLMIICLLCSHFVQGIEIHFNVTGTNGILESPNYPSSYPLNVTCVWTIENKDAKFIKLKFLDFHLEKAKRCIYDYVQIRDTESKPWEQIARHCGYQFPPITKSKGSFLQLKFFSDGINIVKKGFRAKWEIEGKFPGVIGCPKQAKNDIYSGVTICGKRRKKTLVFKQVCSTPSFPADQKENCICRTYENIDETQRPFLIERILLPKKHDIASSPQEVSNVSFVNGSYSLLPTERKEITKLHHRNKRGTSFLSSKVLVSIFSGVLTIFIAVFLVLIILLFQKNKEIFQLRQKFDTRLYKADWISRPVTTSLQSRCRSENGYVKVPTFSKSPPGKKRNQYSIYGIEENSSNISPMKSAGRIEKTIREDWDGYRTTSHIIRTKSGIKQSLSSAEDLNDLSGDETSDIYVSSGFTSPIHATPRSCRCQKMSQYDP